MKLHDIGEFGLIHRFAPHFTKHLPHGVEGIGDDCAIIPSTPGKSTLVTTDLLIENIHFLNNKISPHDLGYKALSVNLSDIAAMGGTPHYAFLSLGLIPTLDVSWIDAFFQGIDELATLEGVYLLGGDTTRSQKDLVINITIIGDIETPNIKRRSQATTGDIIFCTGQLGDSAAGLQVILNNLPEDEITSPLITAHHRPRPHIKEGKWLSQYPSVHAMIDISDGIDSDLQRIMEESSCGATVDLDKLPLSPELKQVCNLYGWNATELASTGGEDYCLLATASPEAFPELSATFTKEFGHPLFPIGTITSQVGELVYTPTPLKKKGFDHFH